MAKIRHSELAVMLVMDGSLRVLKGEQLKGQVPVKPEVLSDREAQDLGLPPGGTVLCYPLGETPLFFDMAGSRMVIWYSGADADRAAPLLDAELKRAYPGGVKQVIDTEHPQESDLRIRAYDVKLSDGLMATIEVSYTKPGADKPKFSALIVGMAIKN
ncbi:hypothetical protein [Terricaulis sp.]|jgi:hypothetical protein|uniref:hypothetical protein n=1 Tax=Terricaulis sp. TaxID=2768686 RepID=UPI002AC637ED|nr:hypothetical protein [Terricaulis sp.]MDZ4691224.1 hypothetical protein [Terricaulis sp.]